MNLTEHTKIRKEKFGTVVFDTLTEKIFVTDEIGSEILQLIEQGKDLPQMVGELCETFDGDWEKVVSACKLLIECGVNTEIVFVPTQFNIHEITDVIDMAYSMGVYGVYTGKTMRVGRAAKNWDIICPSDEDYKKFFDVLQEKAAACEGKMKVYYYPYDVIEELKYRLECPSASLLVIPNGKVKLIGTLPFICGDLKKQSLSQIWENYKKAWKNPEVVEFTNKVIADPKLLAESNNWIEI